MTTLTFADALDQFVSSGFNEVPSLTTKVMVQMNTGKKETVHNFRNIVNQGADAGYNGFCYYNETVDFAIENRTLIKVLAIEQCDQIGEYNGIFSMMSDFNSFKKIEMSVDEIAEYFYNPNETEYECHAEFWDILAKYALEEVARWFNSFIEAEEFELVES